MRSIYRATAILSGSSIINIVVSLITAKVMALCLQPAGYGYYGLLQNFVVLTSLMAGVGMATGIVRLGAAAASQGDQLVIVALRRASWLIYAGMSVLAFLILAIFRARLSQWALGSETHANTIVILAVPMLLTVARNIQMGILNAYHDVKALAKCAIFCTVFGASTSIPLVLLWGVKGIVPAVVADGIVSCAVYRHFLRTSVDPVVMRPAFSETAKAAWSLLRFGGPFTASMLLGTGVQLALPMFVLHMLGADSVGYYRAATAISVGYLGFLVTAMGQDYYPRASAVSSQPAVLVRLINEQHRLVMLVVVPMILGTLALVPYLVPLVYSVKFAHTAEILEWQLIGDLFKFSSWTMSYAILARCGSSKFFVTELISGVAMFGSTWLGVRWFGLPGLGMGFLAAYVIYYIAVWLIICREVPLVWTASNKKMMLTGVVAAFVIRVLPATPMAHFRTPVALILTLAVGIPSALTIWRELMTAKEPSTRYDSDQTINTVATN